MPQAGRSIDLLPAAAYTRLAQRPEGRNAINEADVSAEPSPAGENARVPGADEDAGRAQGAQAAAGKGAEAARGLSGRFSRHERLTRAADFQALFQQGKRIDRPSLVLLWRASDAARRIGFAVSRQVRGSTKRNRVRRRLREAYRASREAAPAKVEMVMVGRPAAQSAPFEKLVADVRGALSAIPRDKQAE
jgi:ribonuclease P protein component